MDEFPVLSEEGLWGTGDGHPCCAVRQQALRGCELFPLPAAHCRPVALKAGVEPAFSHAVFP